MKKLLGGVALSAFLMAPAMAADLPARMPVKAAPVAVTIYNWTGLYIGAQVGGVWGDAEYVIPSTGARATYEANGVIGGGHIGYLWQQGTLVFGAEADLNGTSASGDDAGAGTAVVDSTDLRWAGSVRGILGVSAGQWLFYGTGGFAFANIDHCFSGVGGTCSDEIHTGWTAGGGVKFAFSPNWTAGVEYRFTRYGEERHLASTPALDRSVSLDTNEVTFRLSYRFGGAPVMARY
jgi:outer membrane immunogenic protein